MLYEIDEKAVHKYRQIIQQRREEIETLSEMIEVDKAEGLLLYVDRARKIGEPFDVEELRQDLIDKLQIYANKRDPDTDILDATENIINAISQCVYLKLFVPTKSV